MASSNVVFHKLDSTMQAMQELLRIPLRSSGFEKTILKAIIGGILFLTNCSFLIQYYRISKKHATFYKALYPFMPH